MSLARLRAVVFLAATVSLRSSAAQTQIANWISPRGAIIQNVAIVEGGLLSRGSFANGQWQDVNSSAPANGLLYNINLCNAFDVSQGASENLLEHQNETLESVYGKYIGGGMFVTDYEFYTYGGISYPKQTVDTTGVTYGDLYKPNSAVTSFNPGYTTDWDKDPSIANITTHRAYGAWTSAPSESLGFWFSGLQAANGGAIDLSNNGTDVANTTSTKLVEVNMSERNAATWQELDLPSWLTPRSEGGLVWLPFGAQGILLAFGGFYDPPDSPLGTPADGFPLNTSDFSNTFMTEIAVYDVGGKNWYLQETLESTPRPQAMGQFCTAVTTAQDNSSYFVYVYGGYTTDTKGNTQVSDTMWVLSVPAFEWTLVDQGSSAHGRMNHICMAPSPTQLLSIGGSIVSQEYLPNNDFLDVYDMSTLNWTHKYDPASTALYEVPTKITDQIGGTKTGKFLAPSGLTSSVSSLVSRPYPKIIQGYSPRNCSSPTPPSPVPKPQPNPTPRWLTPVIATLATLVGVAIIGTIIWCCFFRKGRGSTEATKSKRGHIFSWREGVPPSAPKSEQSEDTTVAPPFDYFAVKGPQSGAFEMASTATSPYPTFTHGSPQLVSPMSPISTSTVADRSSRHEMMDGSAATRESMIDRNHPYYPRSLDGDFIMSARSESISHPSERIVPHRLVNPISPYELPHDRSNENLPKPPEDNILNQARSEHIEPSSAKAPAISRKPLHSEPKISTPLQRPVEGDRPAHQRNNSSMSSGLPNLPSPGAEENQRMSRHIDALPDRPSAQIHSIHYEHFDDVLVTR